MKSSKTPSSNEANRNKRSNYTHAQTLRYASRPVKGSEKNKELNQHTQKKTKKTENKESEQQKNKNDKAEKNIKNSNDEINSNDARAQKAKSDKKSNAPLSSKNHRNTENPSASKNDINISATSNGQKSIEKHNSNKKERNDENSRRNQREKDLNRTQSKEKTTKEKRTKNSSNDHLDEDKEETKNVKKERKSDKNHANENTEKNGKKEESNNKPNKEENKEKNREKSKTDKLKNEEKSRTERKEENSEKLKNSQKVKEERIKTKASSKSDKSINDDDDPKPTRNKKEKDETESKSKKYDKKQKSDKEEKCKPKSEDNDDSKQATNRKEKEEHKSKSDKSQKRDKENKEKEERKLKEKPLTKEEQIIHEKKKQISKIGDIDEEQYTYLQSLFLQEPKKAIGECEEYFKGPKYSTYEEFINFIKKTQKSNCCISSWQKPTLSGGCFDCQLYSNNCICIPCFLAGKHEQHHSYIKYSSTGNCDCGDPNQWKSSGNCPHHPGPDSHPGITQMEPEDRKKFITVFKSAFFGAFSSHDDTKSTEIFEWISKFIQFGDGIRRCCSLAITSLGSRFFFNELMNLENKSVSVLIDLLGKLVSDQVFSLRMGSMVILNYLSLRKIIQSFILSETYDKKSKPFKPVKKFLSFSFHFFQKKPLLYLIKEKKFNWIDFLINSIQLILQTVEQINGNYQKNKDGNITYQLWHIKLLLSKILKMDDQHENIQIFIGKYSQLLAKYEATFSYYFYCPDLEYPNNKDLTYYDLIVGLYDVNSVFTIEFDASKKNKKFSIDDTFSSLVDFLKSKENLIVGSIYKAFINLPISPLLPLHHLFYCILSSHQNIPKIVTKSCSLKNIELQDFCQLASIYPLRLLASVFTSERFVNHSYYIYLIIKETIKSPENSFNKFYGLFQTLLGISPDKEIMLRNVAKTFGLFIEPRIPFDNLSNITSDEYVYLYRQQEIVQETAHFEVAVFIMSVLTDRSIITFDKILFNRLRVIELMMVSKPSSSQIEDYINEKISNPIFGDDLSSYAERVKTKNGSYFKVKNEDDFTPFFPLIFHLNRLKIFSKYDDKLVPVLNYSKLPRNLDFVSCFRSHTFIALMFRCLLTENRLMETQVGLSMFILSFLNGPQFSEESFKIESPLKIECQSVVDIISKLDQVLNGDMNFTTIQIKFDKKEKFHSILDLVKSKKQLGCQAITKAKLPIQLEMSENNDEEIQKQKKLKAEKLKEKILKEFQAKQKSFTAGDPINNGKKSTENGDEEEEELNEESNENGQSETNEQLQCSICQNLDPNDVIGFPCLSIHSIFPSIINNKLHNLNGPLEKVFSLSICMHPVHFRCCKNLINDNHGKHLFNCMIDRGQRNCLLPYFPSEKVDAFSIQPSDKIELAIDDFMIKAFETEENIKNALIPLKSFAGIVSVIEVRHRSRPECLDNASIPILLRNLLLTLYFKYNGAELRDIVTNDPLLKLCINILISKKPISEFNVLVNEISVYLNDEYLYEFLRRCAIIEDFALKSFGSQTAKQNFIDWDEVLSFESLLRRFDIINKKFVELPLFETIPLAEKFINLYQPPYNYDIFDYSDVKFVDLLTGQVVIFDPKNEKDENEIKYPKLNVYVKNVYNGGLAMFLSLSGPNSSEIIISCSEIGHLFNLDGFYVDQFGDADRGFFHGSILSLSYDRLENAIDKLLSGEVILNMGVAIS